jgi:hypothetical protein
MKPAKTSTNTMERLLSDDADTVRAALDEYINIRAPFETTRTVLLIKLVHIMMDNNSTKDEMATAIDHFSRHLLHTIKPIYGRMMTERRH